MSPRTLALTLASLTCLLLGGSARAETPEWRWNITPYVWATNLGVDVSLLDHQVVDETIEIDELVKDVDLTAQIHAEGQRGENGLMFDLFDVRMSPDDQTLTLPDPAATEAFLSSEVSLTIFDAAGIYDPNGDQKGFSLVYGTRVLRQTADIEARYVPAGGTPFDTTYDVSDTFVDALVGVRYVVRIAPHWSTQLRADASTGGTDFTWSAGSAISYSFGKADRYAVSLGYRRMDIDFDTGDTVDAEMSLSGMLAGFRFSF